jgi:RimJ/RimL family protein N-acetyltransferase
LPANERSAARPRGRGRARPRAGGGKVRHRLSQAFRVVPLAEEHIGSFRAALDRVARERRYLLFLEAPPPEEVSKFLRNNIRKGCPPYVALVEDKVVGWCDVLPIDRPTRAHNGVLGIAVVPEFRGRGIGTALLRQALEGARAFGFTRIELGYREGNSRVAVLYERFGFVREGVLRKAVRLDGAYEDIICMALLLD